MGRRTGPREEGERNHEPTETVEAKLSREYHDQQGLSSNTLSFRTPTFTDIKSAATDVP